MNPYLEPIEWEQFTCGIPYVLTGMLMVANDVGDKSIGDFQYKLTG